MEKQKNIPTLRFPEFSKNLECKNLGEITSWSSGGTPSKEKPQYWNGNIPWITASSMHGFEYFDSEYKITREGLNNGSRLAKEGQLLILVRGSMLFNKIPVGIALKDVAFNQDVKSIDINAGNNAKFILYWFFSKENVILNLVTGTGIGAGKLDLSDLKNLTLQLPTLPEQTKIASFLTAIDDRLNQLKKKKSLLEHYKKGVMHKIFDQEIRFKDDDGNEFPDWELKKLGEIGETYNGLSGKTKDDFGAGKPYIQYKQIFDNSKIDISRFEYVNVAETEKQNRVFFGDVFFTVSSETPDEIGTASVLLHNVDELYLNSFCFGFRPNSLEVLSPNFAQYLFRSDSFRTEIVKLAQGSTRYNMSKVQLMKLLVNLPCSAEQIKIANFLSAIDEKISLCDTQIAKTEQYKKGLLQQMFV